MQKGPAVCRGPGRLLLPETTQPVSQGGGWTRHRSALDPSAGMRERAASVARPSPGHLLSPGGASGQGPPPGQRWASEWQRRRRPRSSWESDLNSTYRLSL